MARRSKAMSDSELASLLDSQISDAVAYEESDLAEQREKALEYYDGAMSDLPAEPGKSSVVSHDVADTLGWIMPSLMRVFLASDRVGLYEPNTPGDEEFAEQATDYVNYVFLRECDGYRQLRSACFDGLLLGNGVLKHWWDATPVYKTETLTGLSEDAFVSVVNDPDVEDVLGHTERPAIALDPAEAGMLAPDGPAPMLHDVKIKRRVDGGRLRIEALPPEEFLIERSAKELSEDKCRFVAHRKLVTRSDLIVQGYDREIVESLPVHHRSDDEAETSRDKLLVNVGTEVVDASVEYVEIYECYVLCDYDGDGVAEWRKVVMGDASSEKGERKILENEEWGDDLPFTDIVPDPVPHRWRGRSIFDETNDIQRIKSALMRAVLNNTYQVNEPMNMVLENSVVNMDALVNRELGGNVIVKQPGAITPLTVPAIAGEVFPVIQYLDEIREVRTGVSKASMGLDAEALQNQTATAFNGAQAASQSKVELYARNIAEMGLARLFRCLLRLIVKHQDKAKTIRLRDKWVEMDPRAWNAEMSVTINTGLGSGSRDRDLAFMQGILLKQEQILQTLGPNNPLVSLDKYRNALAKTVEAGGIRSPEQFFGEITPEVMEQMAQSAANPPPDPKMLELQAKMQMDQQKAQLDYQMEAQRLAKQSEVERAQAEADILVERQKAEFEMQLEIKRFELERELKILDAQLKAQERQAIAAQPQPESPSARIKIKHGADDITGPLGQAIAQFGQILGQSQQQQTQALMAAIQGMSAPKRVVRDETGRVVGVETAGS